MLTLTSLTTSAQTSDSVKLKKWNDRQIKGKRQRDSLETVFYSTSPFFKVSLELNHDRALTPANLHFYATDGIKKYEPKNIGDDKYEFVDLPDSIKFGLEFDTIKIETGFIKEKFYKNGAGLRFGYFDNVLAIKKKWDKGKKSDDFDEWTEIREPYLDIIKDKKIIKAARQNKIRPIEFISFAPRVYGDGVLQTFRNIRLK
jgi:hypothetical protein